MKLMPESRDTSGSVEPCKAKDEAGSCDLPYNSQ